MTEIYKYILREPFSKTFYFLLPLVDAHKRNNIYPTNAYLQSNLWPKHSLATNTIVGEYAIKNHNGTKLPFDKEHWPELMDYKIINNKLYCLLNLREWEHEVNAFKNGAYIFFTDEAKAIINKFFLWQKRYTPKP